MNPKPFVKNPCFLDHFGLQHFFPLFSSFNCRLKKQKRVKSILNQDRNKLTQYYFKQYFLDCANCYATRK